MSKMMIVIAFVNRSDTIIDSMVQMKVQACQELPVATGRSCIYSRSAFSNISH